MKDKSIEEIIGKSWEKINHELYDIGGINPYAYRLGFLDGYKQKDERIKELEEFIKELIPDPYPEDIFLPISKEELLSIHQMLEAKFNMPLDRLSGHIGRLLRNPLREKSKKLLNNK